MGKPQVLALIAALAAGASAAPATAEETARPGFFSSSATNFAYALREVCFAYVFDGKDDVLKTGWGVTSVGWGPQVGFKALNMQAHLVGMAGRINAAVKSDNGVRRCEIEVNDGDPNAYRAQLLDLVAKRPEPFTPLASPLSPNAYAYRDGWCAPAPSSSFVLASTDHPGVRPVMRVTVLSGGVRGDRCDRADIPPAVRSPAPALPMP